MRDHGIEIEDGMGFAGHAPERKAAPDYSGYSDKLLADTHAFWMGVLRAAKNPQQRARADRGATAAATEMRRRKGIKP